MSSQESAPTVREGYTGHSESAPAEQVLFANGSLVSIDQSEAPDWRVGDSVLVDGEVNVKVTSPDGFTMRLIPQHELFRTHLSRNPEALEELLVQRQAEQERLRREAGAAEEAGELATEHTAEVAKVKYTDGLTGNPDEAQQQYESDWNYSSHENEGDLVKVSVAHAETGQKKDVSVSKEYFDAWEKGEKLPDEKTTEKHHATSSASLERLRLIEHEPVMGPIYGGEGLPPDLENRARLAHLRLETVAKALELGIDDPIDYLTKARLSPEMTKRLQERGWDMTEPPERETQVPRDPVIIEGERGERSRKQVNQIIRMIESPDGRWQLLNELRRPGELPLGLHNIPYFGRRAGRRLLAWRIYRRQRGKRPQTKEYTMTDGSKEVRAITYNDGRFGFGFKNVREIIDGLESLDRNIKVDRSKLSPMNLHEIMGDLLAPRRDLAIQIDRDLRSLIKLGVLKTERLGFYEHAPFKARLKEYESYKDPRKIAKERNEFVHLRFLEVRDAEQQARFEELLNKHPNWE